MKKNQKNLTENSWDKIGLNHHHGINLTLSSLHSKESCGIGEFYDLIPIIKLLETIGFDLIQLLPLNDMGFETSPYNALSSCALNPIYLSLNKLPFLEKDSKLKQSLIRFKKFTYLHRVAYSSVLSEKIEFLWEYFHKFSTLFEKDTRFQDFLTKHTWIKQYALFKALKDHYKDKNWKEWREVDKNPTKRHLKALMERNSKSILFYSIVQYLCFSQMRKVKQVANSHGIFLKGDIPILISPESMDVWLYREEFNQEVLAGAPPDNFNEEGQLWGFPTYNWKHIRQDNYRWWKRRLNIAEEFYDIFRIDHIIGFYRIWGINKGLKAIEGRYIPKEIWTQLIQGEEILNKLLSFATMLPIGEDLGLDIIHIQKSMKSLGIAGTRVMRWEKTHPSNQFIPLKEYEPLTLSTVSTHDSETLEEWFNQNQKESLHFCTSHNIPYEKKLTPELRFNLLKASHSTSSLFHINLLGEYLALFDNMIWQEKEFERINIPGKVLPTNWVYKLRPSVEEIISHKELQIRLKSLIS